mgnify:CR=1 FL=1
MSAPAEHVNAVARAEVWREVADFIAERGEAIYPRDVFLPPSKEDLYEVNALLERERGHQLDGIAAECMRRAYAAAAALVRERAESPCDVSASSGARGAGA